MSDEELIFLEIYLHLLITAVGIVLLRAAPAKWSGRWKWPWRR
jgi:hypothetical protein